MVNFRVPSNQEEHGSLMRSLTIALQKNQAVDVNLLSQLLALQFESQEAEKDFYIAVANDYQSRGLLHKLNNDLAIFCFAGKTVGRHNITEMLDNNRVAALFLGRELILDNVSCAAHLQEEGVFHSAISVSLTAGVSSVLGFWASAVTAVVMREDVLLTTFAPLMPLIAPYLLDDADARVSAALEATTFKTDREGHKEHPQISMLNSIDSFVTKYLMAGLDEARKIQNENLMSNGQYRGRCKVLVALDVRNAIIAGKINVAEMKDVLFAPLNKNGFSDNFSEFMDGSSSKYIIGPLSDLLKGCLAQLAPK